MLSSKDYFLEMQQQGADIDCSGNHYEEWLGAEHNVTIPVEILNAQPKTHWNEKNEQFICTECDNPVATEGMTCSNKCHENSMR